MELINTIIDKLQATFPPNRVVILLGGLITAASASTSAWLAAHFPGLNLGTAEIAGAFGAAALITMRLCDRWLDQWQRHEHIDISGDLEGQLDHYVDSPEAHAFFEALGTFHGLGQLLEELRTKVAAGGITFEELDTELGRVRDVVAGFIAEHPIEEEDGTPIASPVAEATLPVAPQSAE